MNQKDPQTFEMIGAAMEVHRELGHGFLEAVYQDAMEKELMVRKIPFEREKQFNIYYKGMILPAHYKVDFFCYDSLIVELKALDRISGNEESQVINYLKAANLHRGLLINFGAKSLEYKRLVWGKPNSTDHLF